jgi:hypothetical protein
MGGWDIVEIYGLFEIVDRHVLKLNLFGTIDIGGISKNADGHARSGDIWESIFALCKFNSRRE